MKESSFAQRMKSRLRGGQFAFGDQRLTSPIDTNVVAKVEMDIATRGGRLEIYTPKLRAGDIGAIVSEIPKSSFRPDGNFALGPFHIDPAVIRTGLLFYDHFVQPSLVIFKMQSPIFTELEALGVASQCKTIARQFHPAHDYANVVENTFLGLDERDPDQWTILRSEDTVGISGNSLSESKGFSVSLLSALPIFTEETAFGEILEFKSRRLSEVQALRVHLYDIISRVRQSGAPAIQGSIELVRFEKALSDYIQVMKQSNAKKVLASITANINIPNAVGGAVDIVFSQDPVSHALIGSGATLAIKAAKTLLKKQGPNPFEFLVSASKQLM